MATAAPTDQVSGKKSKLPLLIGIVLALAGGGGGFYATYAGLLDSVLGGGGAAASDDHGAPATGEHAQTESAGHGAAVEAGHGETGGSFGFVPLDPITVNIGSRGESRHLRFAAQLEVTPGSAGAVEGLMPRIMDVLNIYLRALDPPELEEPAALLRLRAQMLRRVQIVTGPGLVNDLLIIEFVFN